MNELAIPEDLGTEPSNALTWAKSLTVTTPEAFTTAGERLQLIKGLGKRISDWFEPFKKKAWEAHKAIVKAERDLLDPLETSESLAKAAMLKYQQAEQEKARAEQHRLQQIADEAARAERQKIEQAAQRQRQIEAEARAKADKARQEAEQATAAERKKLLAQAEAADRAAEKAAAKQEVQAEQVAAVVAPVVRVEPQAPRVSGINTRKVWKAEIVDLKAFMEFVCTNKRTDLVEPNLRVLDALAKAMKQSASISGVRFFEDESLAARGR